MPEVSGYDILGKIRQHPKLLYLPVIVLTAATDTESKLHALDLGATGLARKSGFSAGRKTIFFAF